MKPTRGSRGSDIHQRKRGREEDWARTSPSYGNRPKKKPHHRDRSRGSSGDPEASYIQKEKRKYTREQMHRLAQTPVFENEKIEDLSLKFDLVFDLSLTKPASEEPLGEPGGVVFLEADYDKDDRQPRDHYRRDRDYRRKDKETLLPPEKPQEAPKSPRTKEFIKFDDFAKSLGYLGHRSTSEDEEIPLEDKKFKENIHKTKAEREEALKAAAMASVQDAKVIDKWAKFNNELGLGVGGASFSDEEADVEESPEEDDEEKKKTESQYYAFNPLTKKYNFFDELDEEEEHFKPLQDQRAGTTKGDSNPPGLTSQLEAPRKESNDSGNVPMDQVTDITSLWKQMKGDDGVQVAPPSTTIIDDDGILENLNDPESLNRLLSTFTVKGEAKAQSASQKPCALIKNRPSYYENMFGPISSSPQAHSQSTMAVGPPAPQQSKPARAQEISDSNLQSLLGTFAQGGQRQQPSKAPALVDPAIASTETHIAEAEVDLIEGPPPSVIGKAEVVDEAMEKKRKDFHDRYYAMDRALCQVVYDTLNSKRRQAIDMYSTNGINQLTVEKYCTNNYKIFTFLMQGDVFSKIWTYKDKVGNVQGPYMSFDMDIWNGEGTYFSKSLLISPDTQEFFPLSKYLDRNERILELMQDVAEKQQQNLEKVPNLMNMLPKMSPQQPPGWIPKGIMPGQIPLMPLPPKYGQKKRGGGPDHHQGSKKHFSHHQSYQAYGGQLKPEEVPGLIAALTQNNYLPMQMPISQIPPLLQTAPQKAAPGTSVPFEDPAIQGYTAPPTDDLITGDGLPNEFLGTGSEHLPPK